MKLWDRHLRSIWCLVAFLAVAGLAAAESPTHGSRRISISTDLSAPRSSCGPIAFTESSSSAITPGNSFSCSEATALYRAFALSDFGIVHDFAVCNVQIGVESSTSTGQPQPLTVGLHTSSMPFPTGYPDSLTLIGSSFVILADQSLTLLDIPVTGTAPAGSELVVEVITLNDSDQGNLFVIGSNSAPETGLSYVFSDNCGILAPTPTADIGFPDMHVVITVTGDEFVPSAATPASLQVDPPALGFAISGNTILEWGENAVINPGWRNDGVVDLSLAGTILNPVLDFPGLSMNDAPQGGFPPTITIVDATADYGVIAGGASGDCLHSTGDCYAIQLGGIHPAAHIDALFDEHVTPSELSVAQPSLVAKGWRVHVGESFTDVDNDLATDPFYPSIETIFHFGVTAGCGNGTTYCPLQNNLRQEMAVFLLKTSQGSSYAPPACTPPGIFSDVACPGLYTDWIEDLSTRSITGGCQLPGDPLAFCPSRDILRQEMAVLLLKTLLGAGYAPPACTPPGIFSDVACPGLYTDWIEDLYARGVTGGCQVDPDPLAFCPGNPVTRQEMAAFLKITFGLVLYGP